MAKGAVSNDEGDDEEEAAIEMQLELQLEEQKESLAAVDEALASDPSNAELLAVHEELLLAIRDAEEGLLQLRRSHLAMDAGAILSSHISETSFVNAKVEHLDPSQAKPELMDLNNLSVGSKCKFRHINGRWYNGCIIDYGSVDSVISFLNPTSESMLICKFFLQQRCRFGSNCRLSHGLNVPLSLLKKYTPPAWQQSLVGSCIWAVSEIHSGLWRKAELNSWDEKLELGEVVFKDDGSSAKLAADALSISEYADMSEDDEDDNSSSEGYESADNEHPENREYNHQGLGFLEMSKSQRGVQTDIALFANWEHHTRGIASKMMASMGYCKGTGLGVSGQGIVDPIPVKVLPPKQSLDLAVASESNANNQGGGKRRTRGGKRMREKKLARAARAQEEPESDMFSFINNQLVSQDAVITSATKQQKGLDEASSSAKREDRLSLVAYDDETRELRNRIEKLEDMVNRNRNKDKVVFEAAMRKLNETRKALADVEAAHASASKAVTSKEKEKKWLKF